MAKTILVVDDSASLRRVVNIALSGAGYNVIEASDGRDALIKIGGLAGQSIHLIITDLNMPNMDGIEFVTEVKKNPAFKFIPIIMLTTEGSDEKKDLARAAGARAWVHKPFSPGQMLNAVAKLMPA